MERLGARHTVSYFLCVCVCVHKIYCDRQVMAVITRLNTRANCLTNGFPFRLTDFTSNSQFGYCVCLALLRPYEAIWLNLVRNRWCLSWTKERCFRMKSVIADFEHVGHDFLWWIFLAFLWFFSLILHSDMHFSYPPRVFWNSGTGWTLPPKCFADLSFCDIFQMAPAASSFRNACSDSTKRIARTRNRKIVSSKIQCTVRSTSTHTYKSTPANGAPLRSRTFFIISIVCYPWTLGAFRGIRIANCDLNATRLPPFISLLYLPHSRMYQFYAVGFSHQIHSSYRTCWPNQMKRKLVFSFVKFDYIIAWLAVGVDSLVA